MSTAYAPGVIVTEVASGNAPISGAGTSVAAFIGAYRYSYDPPLPSSSSSSSTSAPAGSSSIPASSSAPTSSTSALAQGSRVRGAALPAPTTPAPAPAAIVPMKPVRVSRAALGDSSSSSGGYKVPLLVPVMCTNFTEFQNTFAPSDQSTEDGGNGLTYLTQAVFGFFQNGGTVCWIIRIVGKVTGDHTGIWDDSAQGALWQSLQILEALPGISLICAPGLTTTNSVAIIGAECKSKGDWFAILETENVVLADSFNPFDVANPVSYTENDYIGLYYPWLIIPGQTINIPPCGHLAGIYARVDATRGVFKAPANEVVMGATNFSTQISSGTQAQLNNMGVDCLRNLNNSLLVWGARTLVKDGDWANGKPPYMKYISARRLLNYLKDSLFTGLQWTVFEPNNSGLRASVTRNVVAFLNALWAQGALLGDSGNGVAFYVTCNDSNNPPEQTMAGTLAVEIGVAITEPAEFVQISLSSWAGPPAGP